MLEDRPRTWRQDGEGRGRVADVSGPLTELAASSRLARPRAILFDWDNTLVDSWVTIHEALNITMAMMGQPLWSIQETKERVRLSLRESFPRHFGERWEEARRIYLDKFSAIHLDRLTALPGRGELLEGLAGEGIYMGVVSNKTGALLRREADLAFIQIWAGIFCEASLAWSAAVKGKLTPEQRCKRCCQSLMADERSAWGDRCSGAPPFACSPRALSAAVRAAKT